MNKVQSEFISNIFLIVVTELALFIRPREKKNKYIQAIGFREFRLESFFLINGFSRLQTKSDHINRLKYRNTALPGSNW